MGPLIADGGLATTLAGDQPGQAPVPGVEATLLQRPEAVEAVHRSFQLAGSEVLVTGTFRALPHLHLRWAELADQAVAAARRAADGRARVLASVGPASAPGTPAPAGAYRSLVARLAGRVDGLLLETFVCPDAAASALAEARPVARGHPVVVSLVVGADGHLVNGADAALALSRLLDAGASAVGLNCGSPEGIGAAVGDWQGPGLWLRPGRVDEEPGAWLAATLALAPKAAVLGGCCGVPPSLLRRLADGLTERPCSS